MFNVCPHCGQYEVDKTSMAPGLFQCRHCQQLIEIKQAPLFVVGGASAAGKSTLCLQATGQLQDVVLLDMDILWHDHFNEPETSYRAFFETWLRMAKNIQQSGRPVVLFGAGACMHENIEPCTERRYFTAVHYLAVTCAGNTLAERLKARPAWRNCSDAAFVEQQLAFNQTLIERAQTEQKYPLTLLDTTNATQQETFAQFKTWLKAGL